MAVSQEVHCVMFCLWSVPSCDMPVTLCTRFAYVGSYFDHTFSSSFPVDQDDKYLFECRHGSWDL
jgi:hypothetical protein